MCESAMRSQHACKRWRQCAVLVIDEISMLNAEAFDGLDLAAKGCRRDNAHPFGGLQLLVAGDFYQLPPVSGEFCFTSSAWQSLFPRGHNVHVLRHIFRQRDSSFIRLLNQVRRGVVTPRVERTLQSADRMLGSEALDPEEVDRVLRNIVIEVFVKGALRDIFLDNKRML